MNELRKTTQIVLPVKKQIEDPEAYDIYPSLDLGTGKVKCGYDALAERIKGNKTIIIDGYVGVLFDDFIAQMNISLAKVGIQPLWWRTDAVLKPENEISELIKPYLGGDDPIFGFKTSLSLSDFFNEDQFSKVNPDSSAAMNILIGVGASLFGWEGLTLFLDIPKNEIQFRSRAGSVTNLGASKPDAPKKMYKRFYFVDWVVLNRHKKSIVRDIDIFVDAQRESEITWAEGPDIRNGLDSMSKNGFRVRPWFEPGAWGGQWIKEHIPALPGDVSNYAWSFELISPENGLLFEGDSNLLELSFDFVMFNDGEAVVGKECYDEYADDFPIRMDYLDTFDGGNLSVQCHPLKEYIRKNFGETLTQEETYYILDAKEGSHVFIGFKEGVNPGEFRNALETSVSTATKLDVDKYINTEHSSKHELFLIPPGTLHSAGQNNLVLEISTTPYIFTFKMYDWLRMDLDGKPRPLNIQRAMDNINFGRQGSVIGKELISHPSLLEKKSDWELWEMPTHPKHSYRIQRFVIGSSVETSTEGKCHVLNLVEGQSARIETANGSVYDLHYGETFIVSASALSYRVLTTCGHPIMLVRAFMK